MVGLCRWRRGQSCASPSAAELALFGCFWSCNRLSGFLLGLGDAGLPLLGLVLCLRLGGCSFVAVALLGVPELEGRLSLVVAVARQQDWGDGRFFQAWVAARRHGLVL